MSQSYDEREKEWERECPECGQIAIFSASGYRPLDHDAADVTALRRDAERYRFIRQGRKGTYNTILIYAESKLDEAIDAAIAAHPLKPLGSKQEATIARPNPAGHE